MLCLCGRKSALGKAALCRCFTVLRHSAAVLLPCYANRCYAIATQVYTVPLDAMPLRSYAHLFPANALRSLAMPRPSCSSLSYATATLAASVLCYCCGSLLHALLRLCNASSISSMLRRCGRSLAMLCRRIVPLCYAIAIQFRAFPSPCKSIRGHAFAVLVASPPRRAFADRGSASLLLCPRKS